MLPGVLLSLNAAVFSGSSSLLSPPDLLLLLLQRLPVTDRGCGSQRSPHSLPALREERGGVEIGLGVAGVPALGHGEIPQRPLLVAAGVAGRLLLGRYVRDRRGLPWTEVVVVVSAAGYCGDGGLGGDGCHGAN